MPIAALFDINLDGEDYAYEAEHSEVLSLTLRDATAASTVLFQVYNPAAIDPSLGIAANPPRSSKGAPTLTLEGATSGQAVSPTTVDGAVTVEIPGDGSDSWIVRCVVNGGLRQLPNGATVVDPSLIYERGIYTPTPSGARKIVITEATQFGVHGWAGALSDFMGASAALPDPFFVEATDIALASSSFLMLESNGSVDAITRLRCVGGGMYEQQASATPEGVPKSSSHTFSSVGNGVLGSTVVNLMLGADGDTTPTIRFLGDDGPLVARQSILGGTTQDQIDSLVNALVALGLAIDDRVP